MCSYPSRPGHRLNSTRTSTAKSRGHLGNTDYPRNTFHIRHYVRLRAHSNSLGSSGFPLRRRYRRGYQIPRIFGARLSRPLREFEVEGAEGFIRSSQSVGPETLFSERGLQAFQHGHQHARRVRISELRSVAAPAFPTSGSIPSTRSPVEARTDRDHSRS